MTIIMQDGRGAWEVVREAVLPNHFNLRVLFVHLNIFCFYFSWRQLLLFCALSLISKEVLFLQIFGMLSSMKTQLPCLSKSLLAPINTTHVRFLACMCVLVLFQILFQGESLRTEFTLKGLHFLYIFCFLWAWFMQGLMTFERELSCELLRAHAALK